MNANLGHILGEAQIIPDLRATNRWDAIDELIENLVATGKIESPYRVAVTTALRKRESSMSTGIGFGIGLPHASTDLITTAVAALGRSSGIEFAALDGKPVHLVILFLIPQGQFQKHLHTVAEIARVMHDADVRQMLQLAPDAHTILQIIRGKTHPSQRKLASNE